MSDFPERDHGYGHVEGERPDGRPTAKPLDDETRKAVLKDGGCPNCGCYEIMEISVPMVNPRVAGGMGIGMYLGCPACPWASPMMTRSVAVPKVAGK